MHDNLRDKAEEEELEQADGECEACPVMSVLQDIQAIAIEFNLAIEIHVVESLHGNLILSAVFGLVCLILESKVMFNGTSRKSGLFVFARSERGVEIPEGGEEGDGGEERKEDGSLQSVSDLPCEVIRDAAED